MDIPLWRPIWMLLLLLTLAHPVRGDEAVVRPQIEMLLAAMSQAALAGDQEGYLSCISMADPVFATEQKAWAADLSLHVPDRLEFALTDRLTLDDVGAVSTLRIVWQMPEGRERRISFPARFVPAGEAPGVWRYAGEEWTALGGERILVMYNEGLEQVARNTLRVLPQIREHAISELGLEDDGGFRRHVQQVKLYTSMAHLQFSIYMSYASALGGWNEPGESIKLLVDGHTSRRHLQVVLAHEFGHVATFWCGPRSNDIPWWIMEGMAELVAEPWARNGERTDRLVREWARADALREWELLADFRGEAARHTLHVYRQGHQMMRFITARFGKEARNQWLRAMAQGATLDDATREALGMSFEEVDALWRASLEEEPRKDGRAPHAPGALRAASQWLPDLDLAGSAVLPLEVGLAGAASLE
jgi:hypothetical protein